MQQKALLVGNSDGIGLATTRRLLAAGWQVAGISRSASEIRHAAYEHHVCDVAVPAYTPLLSRVALTGPWDLCIYFAGIGHPFDPLTMNDEARVFDVNLIGMVKTAAAAIPEMVKRGQGHFIGLSSLGDELHSPDAAAYFASKAGFSSYLASLALALRRRGVFVTNIRFGFVDTKMAKSDVKPFMMSVERAVDHVEHCIRRKPARYSAPRIIIPMIKCLKVALRLKG